MLGTQDRIGVGEILRRPAMQFNTPVLEQRAKDTFLNQRVVEEIAVSLWTNERALDQPLAIVVGRLDQMAQGFQFKALAKHRGRLQGLLVGRWQSIDARENQALDRRRDIAVAMLLYVAQQLFQEKRVALRTLDAVERRLIDCLNERTCQPDGIFSFARGQDPAS